MVIRVQPKTQYLWSNFIEMVLCVINMKFFRDVLIIKNAFGMGLKSLTLKTKKIIK
jgi:hypothetical protein